MFRLVYRTYGSRTLLGVVLSCLVTLPLFAAQQTAEPKVNTVRSIRAAAAPAGVGAAATAEIDIELHSTQEFPIRDQVVVLRIGNSDFMKSRSPADGSLNTLIFSVPADEFAQLPNGAQITVRYGKGDPELPQGVAAQAAANRWRWDFGKLDKSLLVQ
jgi:hypothetical protein